MKRSKERIDLHIKCDQEYMDPEAFEEESASIISVSSAPDSLVVLLWRFCNKIQEGNIIFPSYIGI